MQSNPRTCRCPRSAWVDVPAGRANWIKTICGKCGMWIGYRLDRGSRDGTKALEGQQQEVK